MPHEKQTGDDGSRVVVDVEKAAINVFEDGHLVSSNG
jgi:hypothetical protein